MSHPLERLAQELWTAEQTVRLFLQLPEHEFILLGLSSNAVHAIFLTIRRAQAELDLVRMTIAKTGAA